MRLTLLAAALLFVGCGTTRTMETGFLERSLTLHGVTYPYAVWLPQDFSIRERLPVILFLHGAGERGSDGARQTHVGLGRLLRDSPDTVRAIVVFPQCPTDARWLGDPADAAMLALERSSAEFNGDPRRTVVTGLSMGGYGAWHLALSHPHRFAAAVIIAGGIVPAGTATSVRQSPLTMRAEDPHAFVARELRHLPVWLIHGADDTVVLPAESRRMAAALEAAGAEVVYREYQGVGHGSWDRGYGDPELWKWLFDILGD